MASHQWAFASEMAERLGRSIAQSERDVTAAEERLHAAAQERAQLTTEVEAISTLREQQWEVWKQEAQKADQDRLDEVGLRLWQAGRAEDEAAAPADRPGYNRTAGAVA
jgi:flagellar biosynthesis chaperone FliJ